MGDVKPEGGAEGGAATHLQIKIKSQDGDSVEFKVKPTTKLQKIFTVYCEKKGYAMEQVRFMFDGDHLQPGMTVQEASLEDGDAIDCVLNQVGGSWMIGDCNE
eukprot:jgi/Ulvmu1/317/UM001_0321.1